MNKKAFTLIELLVVIAIIGIISGFIVVSMSGATNAAKDAKRKADIDAIRKALMLYSFDHGGSYPLTSNFDVDLDSYIKDIPTDPNGVTYTYTSDGTDCLVSIPLSDDNLYKYVCSSGLSTSSAWACGTGTVDYGGQIYNTVLIGSQCWLKENLNIGTMVTVTTLQTNNGIVEKWCNGADGTHSASGDCNIYGGLYSWDEAMGYVATPGSQGICPSSWHIPTHDELTILERSVCSSGTCITDFPFDTSTTFFRGTSEGTKLKAGGISGFNVILSGYRYNNSFYERSVSGIIMSSTPSGSSEWMRHFTAADVKVNRNTTPKTYGLSVRCIKN